MNSEAIIALRILLQKKNYNDFFKLIEKEIITEFVYKVRVINENYKYSTLPELVEEVEKTLPEKYGHLIDRYYLLTKEEDSDPEETAKRYLEIYEKI